MSKGKMKMLTCSRVLCFIKHFVVSMKTITKTEVKCLPYYWTLMKVDRAKATVCANGLKKLPKKSPNPGIKVYYVADVFGEWDNCVWFWANNNEHAMEYVQKNLSKIPGVVHTYTLPTSPIHEYYKDWK